MQVRHGATALPGRNALSKLWMRCASGGCYQRNSRGGTQAYRQRSCNALLFSVLVMTQEEREQMDHLCRSIQSEKDPRRFTELVKQLNDLLEQTHPRIESKKEEEER